MQLPHDWSTAPAGGYGSFTRLTHDRCGHHTDINWITDEHKARRLIASHECEDLREEREAREEQRAENTASLAALSARLDQLTEQLATRTPTRLLVLDATTPDTLDATVYALPDDDFVALAAAMDDTRRRKRDRRVLNSIHDVLEDELPPGVAVVGVLFTAEEYPSGFYFGSRATALLDDGRTETLAFEDTEEYLRELYGDVDPDDTLAVDLRTDTFDKVRPPAGSTIHERFGIAQSRDSRILRIVRDTLDGAYEHDGTADPEGNPRTVEFTPQQESGEYHLDDGGTVLFDDNTAVFVVFPGIGDLFAETIGSVSEHYSLVADLRANTVTTYVDRLHRLSSPAQPATTDDGS